MGKFSGKSFSWLIYGSTFTFVAVLIFAAYSYRESAYWKKMYDNKQDVQLTTDEQIRQLKLLMTNSELETSLLMRDYIMIDSLLHMQRLANDELNQQLNQSLQQYYQLLRKNDELQSMLEFYQGKIDNLMTELQDSRNKFAELQVIADSLQKLAQYAESVEKSGIFSVELMANYKMISMNASACYSEKKGVVQTKKIKQTEIIHVNIISLPGINFDLGYKTVYIRIADPNGNILPFMKDEVDLFKYQGEEILFSDKFDVHFSSKTFPAVVNYHPVTALPEGIYWVYGFCDGIKIGEASFELY